MATRALDVAVTMVSHAPLDAWHFWDAGYYAQIALHGYADSAPLRAAFWPLYPLLQRPLLWVGLSWRWSALIVSNLATLAAFTLCALLIYHETRSEHAAIWGLLLLATAPLGVFLAAMYSDSLFLALAAGTWLAARSHHWRWAALALALAAVTRPFGVALALALSTEYARQRCWRFDALARNWREVAPLVALPSASLGAFLAVLWRVYGSPLAPFAIEQSRFGHTFRWPWQTLALAIQQLVSTPLWSYARLHMLLDLAPLVFCLAVAVLMARCWPLSFTAYLLAVALLCLISPVISAAGQYAVISDGRYCFAAAPLLLIPAGRLLARWPAVCVATLLVVTLVAQVTLTLYELHGGWLV